MDIERDAKLLTDYSEWKAQKKIVDDSPSAYLVHIAQVSAFEKLEHIERYLKAAVTDEDPLDEDGYFDIRGSEKRWLLGIINGEN